MTGQKEKAVQYREMGRTPVVPLLLRMSASTGTAMLITAAYGLADAFFVSHLGTEASAAVGVVFPIQALLQTVGYTFGMGGGSLLSRRLGAGQTRLANRTASLSFFLSLFTGFLILTIGLLQTKGILRMMGASSTVLPYAIAYSGNLFLAAPFLCGSLTLGQLLRAEGQAFRSLLGIGTCGLLNIMLDPLLIRSAGLGISGASLAAFISQLTGFIILLSFFLHRKSQLRLSLRLLPPALPETGKVVITGLPSLFRQGLSCLAAILINHAAAKFGSASVAAMSVVNRLFLLLYALSLGIAQGMTPIAGFHFGGSRYGRVLEVYRAAVRISTLLLLTVSIPVIIFSPQIIALFRNEPEVVSVGSIALRAQTTVLCLHGLLTCTNMLLQGIGSAGSASLISAARQGLFFLPLILFLTPHLGLPGVLYVQAGADVLSFLFCIPFAFSLRRRLKRLGKEDSP